MRGTCLCTFSAWGHARPSALSASLPASRHLAQVAPVVRGVSEAAGPGPASCASLAVVEQMRSGRHCYQGRRMRRRAVRLAAYQPSASGPSPGQTIDASLAAPLWQDPTQSPSSEDLHEILPLLSPRQLADAILGFTKQDIKPAEDFMAVIAQEVHSKMEGFRSQDLSNTIWALAVLRYQPDGQWWEDFERQVYKNLTDFNGRELANLFWAMAILDHRPVWALESLLAHAADNCFQQGTCSATSLHLVMWSLGKLNVNPSSEWMQHFLRAAQPNFFTFTPSEMSSIIWALAKLGHKLPTKWLDNFLMVAQWRFPSFGAKALSLLIWSTAMLDHRPSQEWLLCYEEQIREKFTEFGGQELACIAWALRKFGCSAEHNAVFYMLERQERFLECDYEILSNSKLLSQVLTWKGHNSSSMPNA